MILFPAFILLSVCTLPAATSALTDRKASKETKYLFQNLRISSSRSKTMIGTEQATTTGEFTRKKRCGAVSQSRVNGYNSDIRDVCGKGPGIYGFDLVHVLAEWPWIYAEPEKDKMRMKAQIRDHIQKIHSRGGVITIHWHINNPITEELYDKGPKEMWQLVEPKTCRQHKTLKKISNCGKSFRKFEAKYKEVVSWFNTLKDKKGKMIPIIFRPFHEQNGNWFFWGAGGVDYTKWKASYDAVWAWMVKYHLKKGKHNLLWATSPNGHNINRDTYLKHVPPLSQVDVLGYDLYGDHAHEWVENEVSIVVQIAEAAGKIPAVTEQGFNGGDRTTWPKDVWTGHVFGPVIDSKKAANRIAWSLTWFNEPVSGTCEGGRFWGPHPRHENANDFLKLCRRSDVLAEGAYKFYSKPKESLLKPPVDQPSSCKYKASRTCRGNNGRGYGTVATCAGGYYCGNYGAKSTCRCRVKGNAKASNGVPYCLANNGCGFGDAWSQNGVKYAKTDQTYSTTCVSFCSLVEEDPKENENKCKKKPPKCKANNGRGTGDVSKCGKKYCAKTSANCKCKISGNPKASNGYPYCLSKSGCGWGTKWPCGDLTCAKTDNTYEEICVSACGSCPSSPGQCTHYSGRGLGGVVKCSSGAGNCATMSNGCECKIEGYPKASNGYPYCLSQGGCGWGTKWDCGNGLTCAKTDNTYIHVCVSKC